MSRRSSASVAPHRAEPRLARLEASILFVEQPIARAKALAEPVHALAREVPVEIDESDADIGVFPGGARARLPRHLGQVLQGVLSRAPQPRAHCAAGTPRRGERYFMSARGPHHPGRHRRAAGSRARDAASAPPMSSATATTMSTAWPALRSRNSCAFLAAHPDLYRRADGRVRLEHPGWRAGAFARWRTRRGWRSGSCRTGMRCGRCCEATCLLDGEKRLQAVVQQVVGKGDLCSAEFIAPCSGFAAAEVACASFGRLDFPRGRSRSRRETQKPARTGCGGAWLRVSQLPRLGRQCLQLSSQITETALSHVIGDKAEQAYRRSDALEKRRKLMDASGGILRAAQRRKRRASQGCRSPISLLVVALGAVISSSQADRWHVWKPRRRHCHSPFTSTGAGLLRSFSVAQLPPLSPAQHLAACGSSSGHRYERSLP